MKNGTMYAAKLRKAYARLRQSVPEPGVPEPDDPLHRLAIAILGEGCDDHQAARAIDRAFTSVVDWNEMRVSSGPELNRATGNAIPQGSQRCQQLIDALQSIFNQENRLSLDVLRGMGRREARHYLEQLNGVDEYATASVVLWSLGGHAIPVNDKLLQTLRNADLVNSSASRAEVQAFLERHVSAADARGFCLLMRDFVATERPASRQSKTKTSARKKGSAESE